MSFDKLPFINMSHLEALDIYFSGFSCQSVSSMRTIDPTGEKKYVIGTSSGKTGSTFQGVCLFLSRKQPKVVIVENVMGLVQRLFLINNPSPRPFLGLLIGTHR